MYDDFFFFNDTATTEIYTLSLHDALPICSMFDGRSRLARTAVSLSRLAVTMTTRSEEHTSELQSQSNLVCRLLLEKKKNRLITSCESPPRCPSTSTSESILHTTMAQTYSF